MKLFETLRRALAGWRLLIGGDPAWRDHFTLTRDGLVRALIVYMAFSLIVQAIQSAAWTEFSVLAFITSLAFDALPVAAVTIGVFLTAFIIRWQVPRTDVLVPAIHGLVFVLLAGTLISIVLPGITSVVFTAYGFMLYRAGRMAAKMSIGSSIAFAVLSVVLLVGLPTSLYILTLEPAGPT